MPFYSWHSDLETLQAAGPALTNTTSQTTLLNGQAKYTLGAQWNMVVGQRFQVRAQGVMSTAASSPGTISFFIMFGSTAVYAGGASPTLATSASGVPWDLDISLTVRSVGSSTAATIAGGGTFHTVALAAATPIQLLNCPGALTGFDSTVANQVDLQAAWSAVSASNSITCHQFALVSCF